MSNKIIYIGDSLIWPEVTEFLNNAAHTVVIIKGCAVGKSEHINVGTIGHIDFKQWEHNLINGMANISDIHIDLLQHERRYYGVFPTREKPIDKRPAYRQIENRKRKY